MQDFRFFEVQKRCVNISNTYKQVVDELQGKIYN